MNFPQFIEIQLILDITAWHLHLGNGLRKLVLSQPGGHTILKLHKNCLSKALKLLYPEISDEEFFKPRNYWSNLDTQRIFLEKIGKKLVINKMEDWYNITTETIRRNGGSTILYKYSGSLLRGREIVIHFIALRTIYPNFQWNNYRFYKPHQKFKNMNAEISKAQHIL